MASTRGERIKEAASNWVNQEKGRTILQLCKLVGITEPTYYNWIKNDGKDIFAGNLMKFSKVTGFNPSYLTNNRLPKLIAEDELLSALLDRIETFSEDEYKDLVKYADMIISARPKQATGE